MQAATDPDPRVSFRARTNGLARRTAARTRARFGHATAQRKPLVIRYGPVAFAVLLMVVILVLGLLLPSSDHFASLLVVPPTIAAAVAGRWTTAAVAAVSCGLALFLDVLDGLWSSAIPGVHVAAIVAVSGLVMALRGVRERSLRELIEVRAVSDAVQRVLLRPLPARVRSFSLASAYHSSQPMAQIGGDLYAAACTPTCLRLVIGDVRGKGISAVEDAVTLLGGFREAAPRAADLAALAAYLEESMENHFRDLGDTDDAAGEHFVTALFLEIPYDSDVVKTVNCGHHPPLLISREAAAAVHPSLESPPLGLNSLCETDYTVDSFRFGPGDTLMLYTDGVVEARDSAGDFYDLGGTIGRWADETPHHLLGRVLDDVRRHTGDRLNDDVAMVAVRRNPVPAERVGH